MTSPRGPSKTGHMKYSGLLRQRCFVRASIKFYVAGPRFSIIVLGTSVAPLVKRVCCILNTISTVVYAFVL